MGLELADTLARQAQVLADLLEGLRLAREPVVTLEDDPLPFGERAQDPADRPPALDVLELRLGLREPCRVELLEREARPRATLPGDGGEAARFSLSP